LLAYKAGIYHAKIKLCIRLQIYKLILMILFAAGICSDLAYRQTYRRNTGKLVCKHVD
jgi:hypothetical protein